MVTDPHLCEQHANQSIMFRLLNALIRENFFSETCHVQTITAPFADQIPKLFSEENELLSISHRANLTTLYVPIKHAGAFQRFRLSAPVYLKKRSGGFVISKLVELLSALKSHFSLEFPTSLVEELKNSTENLTFAYIQWERYKKKMQKSAKKVPQNFLHWLSIQHEIDDYDEYLWSETMSIEGNPFHPCAKMRMGLSKEDRKRFAPEAIQDIPLITLLVPKERIHQTTTLDEELNAFFFRLDPRLYEMTAQILEKSQQPLDKYQLFFVHPWQYQWMMNHFPEEEKVHWIQVPYSIPAKALLSFRTMDVSRLGIHLKLPVQMQITNAVRTLSPQATINGPQLSYQLNQFLGEHQEFAERMKILPERAGVYYQSQMDPKSFWAANFAFTIREHPRKFVRPNEMAFVGAALTSLTPISKQPLVIDLIEQFTNTNRVKSKQAIQFIKHYADRCLPPFLYLLQKYGVALEGHMQNVIVVTSKGRIQRFLVRDMGGIRVHQERFHRHMDTSQLCKGAVLVGEMESVYRKFLHSVIQNHFGDLIFTIAEFLRMDETPLWSEVSRVLDRSLDSFVEYAESDRNALFQPVIQTKALLLMRKQKRAGDQYIYINVENPLV